VSILAGNLHGAESVAVTGNVNHLDAAVAKEVEGLLGRPFRAVPLDGLQVNSLPPLLLIADEAVLAGTVQFLLSKNFRIVLTSNR